MIDFHRLVAHEGHASPSSSTRTTLIIIIPTHNYNAYTCHTTTNPPQASTRLLRYSSLAIQQQPAEATAFCDSFAFFCATRESRRFSFPGARKETNRHSRTGSLRDRPITPGVVARLSPFQSPSLPPPATAVFPQALSANKLELRVPGSAAKGTPHFCVLGLRTPSVFFLHTRNLFCFETTTV